ncbi:NAD(P)/FAD-dependent oxidoreductase [Sphingomonas sp. SRS2]|uniref:NAD(P)/FAD-dependent oxidoreductase n=1 Tax=Sphingomonas sp. SRS2 TaxID=133190 RepID=UPI0006184828|nr:NAD(P)/FAD-dependent oxidoreductase [Sphingomonas sp. SRS2]KKC27759.1 FAD-dependent oxidoreductase [Sphingomonas sp. SRS2]
MLMIDVVVIGGGVVGLSIARSFAVFGYETIIVDGEAAHGTWTSSRNSEVIHAGIYYPRGSLKASLCTRGRALLYRYCTDHDVPHRRTGKIIFAADAAQAIRLDEIKMAADAAGVDDLRRLSAREAADIEPELVCHEALLSPSTGIIDSHAYMNTLLGEAAAHGAIFAGRSTVTGLSRRSGGWGVHINGEREPAAVARSVVNAGGLAAHDIALSTEGLAAEHVPDIRYARGVYFTYSGRVPFRHLIYPVPVPGGLGTHLTLDMAGMARFGPDVEWIDAVDYTVDPARGTQFLAAARLIWAGIDANRLQPGYAGVRPKIGGPGSAVADFRIDGPERHGLPGLVNLFGIESPGLTASLAIAEVVAARLGLEAGPAGYPASVP